MTLQHDLQAHSSVFSALVEVEMTDSDRSRKGNWKSEARLSMLSHEITRYMPELAALLAEGGKQKLLAAA
jgi:hypothetical protein